MRALARTSIALVLVALGGALGVAHERAFRAQPAAPARVEPIVAQPLPLSSAPAPDASEHAERVAALEAELDAARREFVEERDRRIERERQFLAFQRGVGSLGSTATFGPGSAFDEALRDALDLPPPEGSAAALADADAAARAETERTAAEAAFAADSAERAVRFNTLLRFHGVHGIDLLEPGARLDHGWGPVVFRTVDGEGRLSGHIGAAALRLAGSRAGRTLSLVLTEGHTARGAERVPFDGGELRLTLRDVPPEVFLEAFPELFDGGELGELADDGRWPLGLVRLRLNQLFAQHPEGGHHVVTFLGGVVGEELVDLAIEVRDADGRVERLLYADRAKLVLEGRTLGLELTGGSSQRGDRRVPFLDGRLRIVLPRVDDAAWRAAGLPGLSATPPARD